MAKKEQLLFSQQHELVDGDITKQFTAKVYKGRIFRKTKWREHSKVVEVKAFRIEVSETWVWDNQEFYHDTQDFGYITARSGEFAHVLRRMKECANLDQIRVLIADVEVDFRVAIDKDAMRELKRILGLRNNLTPVVRTNKQHQPLPQIKLPWVEE